MSISVLIGSFFLATMLCAVAVYLIYAVSDKRPPKGLVTVFVCIWLAFVLGGLAFYPTYVKAEAPTETILVENQEPKEPVSEEVVGEALTEEEFQVKLEQLQEEIRQKTDEIATYVQELEETIAQKEKLERLSEGINKALFAAIFILLCVYFLIIRPKKQKDEK